MKPLRLLRAVTNLAQGLVFGTLGFLTVAAIGVAITYNAYPQVGRVGGSSRRCCCCANAAKSDCAAIVVPLVSLHGKGK